MPGFEILGSEEFLQVKSVFDSGGILFRHGFDHLRNNTYKVKEFEQQFAAYMGSPNALAVTSGTAALRVALAALGVKSGDEVITQSFTFVATVEAIIESRATPICTEIDNTLNMDPNDLLNKITPKTKAVIVVHMLGTPARMDIISRICSEHNIPLIEDTAWGCGGSFQDKKLGTWGDIGTYSFDFAKTMTTGEGGMVVFNNHSDYLHAAAWHDHGHENNPKLPRWMDSRSSSGFNFRMMELQGAIGLAQLKKLDYVVEKQRINKSRIMDVISQLPSLSFREVPVGSFETADALVFFVPHSNYAIACRNELLNVGLTTKILPEAYTWHFASTWDHMDELVNSHNNMLSESFPQSYSILSRSVSLPINLDLTDDTIQLIYKALKQALS